MAEGVFQAAPQGSVIGGALGRQLARRTRSPGSRGADARARGPHAAQARARGRGVGRRRRHDGLRRRVPVHPGQAVRDWELEDPAGKRRETRRGGSGTRSTAASHRSSTSWPSPRETPRLPGRARVAAGIGVDRLGRRSRPVRRRGRARGVSRRRARGPSLRLAGARARRHAGPDGAAADLVVGPPDPRPVDRGLAVPRSASRLQQDVRRRAPPRNARRGRRVLLVGRRPVRLAWIASVRRARVETADERLAWGVFFATIPAAIAGALGEETIESHLGQPWQIAIFLAVFAGLLWVADRMPQRRGLDGLGIGTAFAIGVSQILALMPGTSRSGITITTGRFAGLDRDAAARFSFLLLVPVVFGAVIYKGVEARSARVAARGLDRSVHRRDARRRGRRARSRSTCCSATCAATTTRVRDLPARPRRGDRDRDRVGRAFGDLLAPPIRNEGLPP